MTLLLLAGTREAQQIAAELDRRGVKAIASLAGVTRAPAPLPLETLSGGFGGEEGFRAVLAARDIRAVLDATHPFAHGISARTARICRDLDLPYAQVLRPEWTSGPGDRWTFLNNEAELAPLVAPGDVVFLATGRQTLNRFSNLSHASLICRQIDPPDGPFPFANGRFLVGRPPFSVDEEVDLFKSLGVDWLVVKNAGGTASASKLIAARQLSLRVAMIKRPPLLNVTRLETVDAALDWVAGL